MARRRKRRQRPAPGVVLRLPPGVRVTWDPRKADSNLRDHQVDFDEAAQALFDPAFAPHDHFEEGEWRQRGLAFNAATGRLLFVVYLDQDPVYRLISARVADPHEWHEYLQENLS